MAKTYTFYAGDEKIDGSSGSSYLANQQGLVEGATVDDLREYWDSAENLRSQFGGDWDKYLSYMDERQSLIDSGEYNVGEYGQIVETSAVQNVDGTMIEPSDIQNLSKNDFIAKYGLDPSEVQLVNTDTTGSRAQGFTDWSQSDAVVALNEKYGIDQLRTTEEGREYQWNGSAYVKTKDYDNLDFGGILKAATAVGAGVVLTPALAGAINGSAIAASLSSATGLTAGTISTAGGAMVGSSVGQFLMTGEVDPTKVLISGITAGILETANALQNMDPSIVTSDTMGFFYDEVDKLSELLNTDFETALDIAKAVSIGAIEGGDLEGIVKSSLSILGADEITDLLNETVGLEIPNFFEEGTTTINSNAVEEAARILLRDGMNGELDEGTLLSMGLGYIRNDGSFAFADPSSLFPDSGDFDIFDGFFDGFENPFKGFENPFEGFENPFEGFDFEFKGGEGFDLDFTSNEAQALADSDTFGEYFDPDDYDNNVILQYDQGTVDSIMAIIEAAKQAGRDFDDSVLQPIKETIQEAGYVIDDNVLQPIKDGAIALYDMLPDVTINGPNLSGPNLSSPNRTDLPDVDTGGFDFPDLKFGKPFGDELEGFNPFAAPAMGQEIPLLAKVKPQNAYDPRRAGSSIVSSMFAEYLG